MSEMYPLVISKITRNTPNAVLISFEIPEGAQENFRFEAGQYLTLETNINENKVRRSYSICSAPGEELQVGIKEVPKGVFSTHANRKLKEGESLLVAPPEGRFKYGPSNGGRQLAAFAAGSGITPIMSIIKAALSDHQDTQIYLVYGNKTPEETMFYEELKALENKYNGRLRIKWVFSRANVEGSFFGRIEAPIVKNTLNQLKEAADKFYLCGPEAMIQSVSETLKENGVASPKILFELFTASSEASADVSASTASALEIIYDDVSYKLDAQEGKSILDTALDNKLDVPYSCQGGVCSSCIARIKSGKAEMESNLILTDDEIEEGLILTCQAHATSKRLVVNYDDV